MRSRGLPGMEQEGAGHQELGGLLMTGGEVTGRLQEDTLEMPPLCMMSEDLCVLIVVCTTVSGSGLQFIIYRYYYAVRATRVMRMIFLKLPKVLRSY